MTKNIRVLKSLFQDVRIKERQAPKLRGYFANKYAQIESMHNHRADKFIYSYPLVQYKVIDEIPHIIVMEHEIDRVGEYIFKEDKLIIEDMELKTYEKYIKVENESYGVVDEIHEYEFVTPWLSLNQNNVKKYRSANDEEKKELLKKVLIGNLLSASKGLDYRVEDQVHVEVDLKEIKVNFKNSKMIGFKGNFKTNFKLIDHMGLGKSVSRGFGTIKMM
ncbi:MAG: CRISPR-associated endonuclease Cas6 [Anaeromicrobium sp.]|uniref:CRISPR-associated endonuclease Cas6 n=1 Tax=Anaeromicrobium sp. TaxID=1929132 RepID=UPI0025D46DB0|nr:CRISPR-associated endonuclease Cas6 [Anaeromicrobium sp.]MCT4594746.1 CRISPR-associated endonuclease Cas6 [Anaeromicrobium sp.]